MTETRILTIPVKFTYDEHTLLLAAAQREGKDPATLLRETFLTSPLNRAIAADYVAGVGLSAGIVHDMIGLVTTVDVPPLEVVQTWDAEHLLEAAVWASAEHLNASDNNLVRRIDRPAFTRIGG
jgi:hypothetical protein